MTIISKIVRGYLYGICVYYIVIGATAVVMAISRASEYLGPLGESLANALSDPLLYLALFLVGLGGIQFGAVPSRIQLIPSDNWVGVVLFGFIGTIAITFGILGFRSLRNKLAPRKSFFLWLFLFILSVLFLFIPPIKGGEYRIGVLFPLLRFLHPALMGFSAFLFFQKSKTASAGNMQKTG